MKTFNQKVIDQCNRAIETKRNIIKRQQEQLNELLEKYSKEIIELEKEIEQATQHHHTYKKDRNSTRKHICECGHSYTPAS